MWYIKIADGDDNIERICEKCGIVLRDVHGNTKYCEFCKAEVRKEQVRRDVHKHRENKGIEEVREDNRRYIEDYRDRWGWSNKNECLGSGRLSPKPKPNFDDELAIIRWELRRLGVR